ncbi:MAG: DM13 domain-containing protein [Pseudomonadota bacterium]
MIKQAMALCAAALLVGACAPAAQQAKPAAPTVTLAQAADAAVTARGTFEGKSKHITTGHASIGRVGKQWVVILEDDFTFDGAPDPRVALGSNGYDKNAQLALLSSNAGKQVYAIPAGLDVANFNEVWIWCKKFSVPLGLAKLTLT